MSYLMAIDQGGTKTDILIADEYGNILSLANDRDYQRKPNEERREGRMKRLRYAADKASAAAKLSLKDISSVTACLLGADWPFEYALGVRNLRRVLELDNVILYNDCIGALRGGTEIRGRDCAVLCLGTGGNCAVHSREGREYVYGYYFRKEHQGAEAIGRFVFQAVYDAAAGLSEPTVLARLLLEAAGYAETDELLTAVTTGREEYEKPWRPIYQDYAGLLFKALRQNDCIAEKYIRRLSDELICYITAGASRLGIADKPLTLVLSGGVFKNTGMRSAIESQVLSRLPGSRCADAVYEPVVGTLLLALDGRYNAGLPAEVMNNIDAGCKAYNLFRRLS